MVARLLLGREAPTVVVNGHVHLRATRIEGPALQVSCAALVEPPFEVTLLDLEKLGVGRVKVRRESAPLVPSLAVRPPAFSPRGRGGPSRRELGRSTVPTIAYVRHGKSVKGSVPGHLAPRRFPRPEGRVLRARAPKRD